MRQSFILISIGLTLITTSYAQVPTCSPDVPYYYIDLTGQPAGTWESPGHSRDGNCCGTTSPDRCTSFDVVLDTQTAMISFNIASGAIPTGSMFYQINCGPQVPVGQPICIVGAGPHHVTFCKPGNNQNTYIITAIPKPIFPADATVRFGCSKQLITMGMETASVTWTSVYPGAQGQYNSYLSCTTGCPAPVYTPAVGYPPYIDYKVCGYPIADECGFVAVCDTVRIYNVGALSASVSPNPAQFCAGGGGVQLTASASGGQSPYTYIWKNQNGNIVGTGTTYQATSAGIFTMEARDVLYDPAMCPPVLISIPVVVGLPPVVNAGADQTICASSPVAYLTGTVQNATGGVWTGGSGTFFPDNLTLTVAYTPTAAEVLAGSVTFTLTSTGAGGGCTDDFDEVTIYYPPLLSVSLGSQSLSCNNSTATLSPVVSGGVTPYGFSWNTGSNASSINAGAGNYCVNITDAMGCPASACANITVPSALALTMSSTDATTNGGSDGTATATPSGGTLPYIYLWTPGGQTTQTATGLSYGVYSATVTDANGCSVSLSTVVNEPRCLGFQVTTSGTNILCNGDLTGTADAVVAGGTVPYTYLWNTSPAQTTTAVSNLGAGTYMATVTDAGGCTDVSSIVITQPAKLVNTMNHTNTSVVAGTDGSATANISGGTTAYTYSWSNGETTSAITGLTAGIYTVAVTDNNGCMLADSVQVDDPPCSTIIMNVYVTPVSCPGASDGTATAQVLFGVPPYVYQWSTGETTSTITGLSAGVYTVYGTGALLCPHWANVIVSEPSPLSLGLAPTHISCSDKNDGTVDLAVSGGTYPYSYAWSNGINVEDQAYLSDGNYSVTVTDANGCSADANTSITRPSVLTSWDGKTDVTCFGGSDGGVDADAGGGVLPYSYLWSNGETTQDISGLTAGQYILVVTDANGCTPAVNLSALIDEPELVNAGALTINCPVPNSGLSELMVTPAGGNNGPYQISVDSGATYLSSGTFNVFLPVDSTYYVFVKDGNGCLSLGDTVNINPEVTIPALNISYAKCFSSGTSATPVTVTPTGGAGGLFQVSFDNGSNFGSPGNYSANLPIADTYSIVVRDSLGCVSAVATIVIPDTLSLSKVSSSYAGGYNVSCKGLSNGSINLSVAGGTTPYTYLWSNTATTEDISGITAGNYSVNVTDANGCTKNLSVTLSEPALLTGNLVVGSDYNGFSVSCNGSGNGWVGLTVSGGAAAYTYSWSNNSTTQNLSSLTAGNYSVIITDANGCTATNSVILTQPAALSLSTAPAHVTCNGLSNGVVDLTVSGGVAPYLYSWSNGQTTEDVSGLAAGVYSVTATDANGCTMQASAVVSEPVVLSGIISKTDVLCNGGGTGTASIAPAGGTPPFSFLWSSGQTTSAVTGLTAGSYSVTVTDNKGCIYSVPVSISQPPVLSASTSSGNVSCNGGSNGSVSVNAAGGTLPYTFVWSDGQTTSVATGLSSGNYSVTVTDANGCTVNSAGNVTEPPALTVSISNTNISCFGGNNGTAAAVTSGGTPAYSYLWSNGQTTSSSQNLPAGTYTVAVTDANGCTNISSVIITQPASLALTSTITGVSCNGGNDGSVSVIASGGTVPYAYLWSNNQTNAVATGLSVGTYSVWVTDANGCSQSSSINVTEETPVLLSSVVNDPFCYGNANGSINLSASGGVSPYSFLWSNGATTQNLSGLSAGSYIVNVLDGNQCKKSDTILVTQPDSLSAEISGYVFATGYNIHPYGGSNGAITLAVSGGTPAYQYSWSNGSTAQNPDNLPAGYYSVIVTDNNGCTYTTAITLTEPYDLAMPTGISPNGDTQNDFFVVRGLDVYLDNRIEIFNRWGDLIYSKDGYANEWNGENMKGKKIPDGTYFVVLNVKIGDTDKILTGYVDVRR